MKNDSECLNGNIAFEAKSLCCFMQNGNRLNTTCKFQFNKKERKANFNKVKTLELIKRQTNKQTIANANRMLSKLLRKAWNIETNDETRRNNNDCLMKILSQISSSC